MNKSTFGNLFSVTTWGESHGPAIGAVVDGCPAGLPLSSEDIQIFLDRRKPGQSRFTTARKEDDAVEILSGVFEGKTTGTPISLMIRNKDQRSRDYGNIAYCYRPGHADFTFDGHRQTRILALDGAQRCSVMLTSATKSFNLAGLRQSSIIAPDAALRKALSDELARAHATSPNIFGSIAQTTAYRCGDEWMDAVVEYVRENRDFAIGFLRERLPEIGCAPQEGTYLMWLDFSGVGLSHEAVMDLLVNRARVALNSGLFFGETGRGWFRLNLATPRANVERTLENISKAIRSR